VASASAREAGTSGRARGGVESISGADRYGVFLGERPEVGQMLRATKGEMQILARLKQTRVSVAAANNELVAGPA